MPGVGVSTEQLEALKRSGREALYLPRECNNLAVLRELFLDQFDGSASNALGQIDPSKFQNSHGASGWIAVERILTWDPHEQQAPPDGYTLQPLRLAPYIVGSQAAKELWGGFSHFDEANMAPIHGTTLEGSHITVMHDLDGAIYLRTVANAGSLPDMAYDDYQMASDITAVPARSEIVL